ncbi:MAG: hypothetical protein JW731_06285 [Bacteroidales bacterium]|nr:hypothetical protein [Bacteroidales bacterium]
MNRKLFFTIVITIIFSLFLSVEPGFTQKTTQEITNIEYPGMPELYSNLPEKVEETSGVIYFENALWTFNDSGGKPELYKIDRTNGKISGEIKINNATNVDWEDIDQDEQFIYIGDFGNNRGNRQDLKIYKIDKKKLTGKDKQSVDAEVIQFNYTDQADFEIQNRKHNFDCESLITFGDSLIVFTKNWNNGKTRMYKLPKDTGQFSISPVETFNADGLVTGADYNQEAGTLALIGYKNFIPFIYVIQNFDGNGFGNNAIYRINLLKMKDSQTEGIYWKSNDEVLISTESSGDWQPSAYILNINQVLNLAGFGQ